PARVELFGRELGGDAAVGRERAVAVGSDDRDDDAGRACRDRAHELDATRRELTCEQLAGRIVAALGDAARAGAELPSPPAHPAGLAAFEEAPCFRELLLQEERSADERADYP